MLETIFWVAVGAFIGWNIPQPDFAKKFQDSIVEYIKK